MFQNDVQMCEMFLNVRRKKKFTFFQWLNTFSCSLIVNYLLQLIHNLFYAWYVLLISKKINDFLMKVLQ